MAHQNIISVNPGKIADGARFPELITPSPRVNVTAEAEIKHTDPIASFLFPTRRTGWKSSLALLLVRAALCVMILMAVNALSMGQDVSVTAVVAASLCAVGLLTRPVCIIATFFFIFNFGHIVAAGDVSAFISGLLSVLLAVAGPGRISFDGIVRYVIMRSHRAERRRKQSCCNY